jgi:hypothetical protein
MSNEVTKARNKFLRSTLTAIKASVRSAVLAMNNHEERISILKQQLDDYGITLDDFEVWTKLTTGEQLDLFGGGAPELDVSRIMGGKALEDIGTIALYEELNRRGMPVYVPAPAIAQLHLAATEELLDELKERDMARVSARLKFDPDAPLFTPEAMRQGILYRPEEGKSLVDVVNDARDISGQWLEEPAALLPVVFAPLPSTERALEDSMRAILNAPADDNDEEEQDDKRADSQPESVVADFVDGDVNDADLERRAGVFGYVEADGG